MAKFMSIQDSKPIWYWTSKDQLGF